MILTLEKVFLENTFKEVETQTIIPPIVNRYNK